MRKIIFNFWENRRERFYRKKRWHLFLDIFLIIIMIVLAAIFLRLSFYNPNFINLITVPDISIDQEAPQKTKEIKFTFVAEPFKKVVDNEENIIWNIKYENIGEIKIDKVEFHFDINSSNFQLINLKINETNETEEKIEIKDEVFTFKNIDPGEVRTANLEISWRNPVFTPNQLIEMAVRTKSFSDKLILDKTFNLQSIRINSDLNLEANLYYHSPQGDQLGIGPIPPVVGIPTKYWLIVKATNRGNNLSNLVFSAQLAPGVQLADEYSLLAGKFSYNESKRRLIWQVESLDAQGSDYIANFALNFIPTSDQIGKNALILTNLEYYVDDNWTGLEIVKKINNLDTSLPADRLNKGEGRVLSE